MKKTNSIMERDNVKITCVAKRTSALGMLILAMGLTACGASGGIVRNQMAYEETYDTAAADSGGVMLSSPAATESAAYEEEIAVAADEAVYEGEGSSMTEVPEQAASERKLIKTVNIYAETEAFDALLPEVQNQVEALGGYIESISVYDMNSYYVEEQLVKQRGADLTARVPKEKLDGFLSQVAEQTNVTSRSESVEDVTLQYVDLESHKKALLTEQERLLELLGNAESVEDIIAIEGRLSEVRYQLESMESQLRTYDNKIDYSTVYLSIVEVRKYSPSVDASVGQRIASGFVKSLEDIGYGIRDFAIGFVIDIPYIVLWIILIAVVVLVWRILRKIWKKRAVKRSMDAGVQSSEGRRQQFRLPFTVKVEKAGQAEKRTEATDDEKEAENRKTSEENNDR